MNKPWIIGIVVFILIIVGAVIFNKPPVKGVVKNGDTVLIDFIGTVDGVAFAGGTAENYELVIGSKTFIDDFEEQIIGMKKGEVRDIQVTFPDQYDPALAGKDAVFKTTLKAIK